MSKDIGEKTRSGLYWNVSLRIPYEVFRFVISIFVARMLEPKDFGIVSIATMAIYYSNTITNFGFNQALVQRKDITKEHINSVFTFDLAISVFLACVFFLSAPLIASFFNSPESKNVIRVLSTIFVVTTFHDIPYTLLRRDIKFHIISIFDMTKEVSMSLISLVLAILGFKYWAIVWGQLIPLSLATLYLIYKVRWKPKISYHHPSLRELFDFGFWSLIRSQVLFFSSRIDRIIIGRMLNTTALGLYDKAKSLYQMPTDSIALNINSVLFSSFSRIQHDTIELKKMFSKSLIILSAINFPIYFGLYALSHHFVVVLFGQKWIAMILPLQILCISGLFMTFNGLISAFIVGTGNYRRYTMRLFIATLFLFLVSIFLVKFGIAFVAVAVTLFSILLLFLGFNLIKESINMTWKNFAVCITPALCCSLIMLLTVEIGVTRFFHADSFSNLLLMTVLGTFVYMITLVFFPAHALSEIRSSIYRDCQYVWNRTRGFM